jgi:hypothetical protein
MSNFDARADLHRSEMRQVRLGEKNSPVPRYLRSATLAECVAEVMAMRETDRVIYSITVPLEAGFGKTELYYPDIEAIAQRPDFPATADQ